MFGCKVVCVALLALISIQTIHGKIVPRKIGIPSSGAPQTRAAAPKWGTIVQPLNHFDVTDNRTWTMRYMSNDQFFKTGGPIFIFLGGEWEISAGYLQTGSMFDMAAEHSGDMYYIEHRYYGESYPMDDFSTESLKYLSADQALADMAYFIEKLRADNQLTSNKVVVVGGSYSASLATWARLKYPHLVTAAQSSSAPLRAVADFYEYLEVVSDNMIIGGSIDCWNIIKEGVAIAEELIKTDFGLELVSETFNTCTPVNTEEPYRSYFFESIATAFSSLVQYASPGQIGRACDALASTPGTSMDKLAEYVQSQYNYECMGDYDEFIEYYGGTELTRDAYRQWMYQTCTEYGYYQTGTSDKQPFGNNFNTSLSVRMCKDLFGESFSEDQLDRAVKRTNIMYGDNSPEITQVISIHGSVDPWHALGIDANLSQDKQPSVYVNGTAHCADLGSIVSSDLDEMKEAKKLVQVLIASWIQNDIKN